MLRRRLIECFFFFFLHAPYRYRNASRRWTRAWSCCSSCESPWSGPYRITRSCTATRWRTAAAGRSSSWWYERTARWTPTTGRSPCPRTTITCTGGWTCSRGSSCSSSTATGSSPTRCPSWAASRRSWGWSTASAPTISTSTGPRGSTACVTTRWTSAWRRPRAASTRTSGPRSCPSSASTSATTTRSCMTCWARTSGGRRSDWTRGWGLGAFANIIMCYDVIIIVFVIYFFFSWLFMSVFRFFLFRFGIFRIQGILKYYYNYNYYITVYWRRPWVVTLVVFPPQHTPTSVTTI